MVQPMLISERYVELFEELHALQALVALCLEPAQRACYREQAERLQRHCGEVAQCIGLFGSIAVEDLTAEHVAEARSLRCTGTHPWLAGLRLMRPDLF